MPTPAERKALAFLALVALLGAAVRVAMDDRSPPRPANSVALDSQLAAVEAARGARGRGRKKSAPPKPAVAFPIDVDRASASEIDALPGVGPVIAKRVLAERDSNGPFGCLQALTSVKGIGPATVRRLDTLLAFSGPRREICR